MKKFEETEWGGRVSEGFYEERKRESGIGIGFKIVCVIVAIGLAAIVVNVYAGLNAAEYGMSADDLRRELWMALFYGIIAAIAFIIVGRSRRLPRQAVLTIRVAIALAAWLLIKYQMAFSLELAPIKEEFTRAAEKCRVVARGELNCGDDVAKVLAKRDMMLASINAKMVGEWRVTAPRPETREVTTGALYFPSL